MSDSITDRCVGTLLGVMVGDALGAAVEGFARSQIKEMFPHGVQEYVSAPHMGVEYLGPRMAMYTDDTNSTLALATSLVDAGGLDPVAVARKYALFYDTAVPKRGYPRSAQMILEAVKKGHSIHEVGRSVFEDGSFANGGAMRISPVGLAFRNASDAQLRDAVRMAIISSHCHPESVDGAYIVAKAIAMLVGTRVGEFDGHRFMEALCDQCRCEALKHRLGVLKDSLSELLAVDDVKERGEACYSVLKAIECTGFQIRAIEAVPCAILGFVCFSSDPQHALVESIGFGGDTDTVASIAGGLVGALHGKGWIKSSWVDPLENEKRGRDYCIEVAQELAQLDLFEVLEEGSYGGGDGRME